MTRCVGRRTVTRKRFKTVNWCKRILDFILTSQCAVSFHNKSDYIAAAQDHLWMISSVTFLHPSGTLGSKSYTEWTLCWHMFLMLIHPGHTNSLCRLNPLHTNKQKHLHYKSGKLGAHSGNIVISPSILCLTHLSDIVLLSRPNQYSCSIHPSPTHWHYLISRSWQWFHSFLNVGVTLCWA